MNPYVKALPIIVFSVLLNAFAQIAMKKAVSAVGMAWAPGPLVRLFLHPWMLVCLGCYAVSVVVWAAAMSHVPVNYAYPFLALGFVAGAFMSQVLLGETIPPMRWLAIGVIVAGVVLLAFTGVPARPPQAPLTASRRASSWACRAWSRAVPSWAAASWGEWKPAEGSEAMKVQRICACRRIRCAGSSICGEAPARRAAPSTWWAASRASAVPAPQGEGPRLDGLHLGPERLLSVGMASRAAGVHIEQRAFHAVANDPRRAFGPDRHVAVHAGDAAPGMLALEPQFVGGAPRSRRAARRSGRGSSRRGPSLRPWP